MIALGWITLGAALGVLGSLAVREWLPRDRGPSWAEVRALDAWLLGREAGRREVIAELMLRRGEEIIPGIRITSVDTASAIVILPIDAGRGGPRE